MVTKVSLVIWLLFFSLMSQGNSKLDRRMELLDKLDMLDALEFQELIESAATCTNEREFHCAEENIEKAKQLAVNVDQKDRLGIVNENLYTEKEQVKAEKRLEAKRRRIEREDRENEQFRIREERRLAKKRRKDKKKREREREEREYERTRYKQPEVNSWAVGAMAALDNMSKNTQSIEESNRKLNNTYYQIQQDQAAREQREDDQRVRDQKRRKQDLKAKRLRLEEEQANLAYSKTKRTEKIHKRAALALSWVNHARGKDYWWAAGPVQKTSASSEDEEEALSYVCGSRYQARFIETFGKYRVHECSGRSLESYDLDVARRYNLPSKFHTW